MVISRNDQKSLLIINEYKTLFFCITLQLATIFLTDSAHSRVCKAQHDISFVNHSNVTIVGIEYKYPQYEGMWSGNQISFNMNRDDEKTIRLFREDGPIDFRIWLAGSKYLERHVDDLCLLTEIGVNLNDFGTFELIVR